MSHPRYYRPLREEVQQRSEETFKDHVLTSEGEGRWYFGRPGSTMYCVRVIASPGNVIMLGDCGDLILRCSDRDSLAWLRGTMDRRNYSLDYVSSKISQECKSIEFQQELVTEFLKELEDEADALSLQDKVDEDEDEEDEDEDEDPVSAEDCAPTDDLEDEDEGKKVPTEADYLRIFVAHVREGTGYDDKFQSAHDFYEWAYHCHAFNMLHKQRSWPYSDEPPCVEGLTYWTLMKLEALRFFVIALRKYEAAQAPLDKGEGAGAQDDTQQRDPASSV